jgi:hypothetical protein
MLAVVVVAQVQTMLVLAVQVAVAQEPLVQELVLLVLPIREVAVAVVQVEQTLELLVVLVALV